MFESSRWKTRRVGGWRLWAGAALGLALMGVLALGRSGLAEAGAAQTQVFGVKRESGGAVMVALTPRAFAEGRLTVEIGVTTHTVNDLDRYDLTEIVTLKAGERKVAPVAAPQLRGHHSTGDLVFSLDDLPSSFSIEIRDLDQPGVRTFSWP